MRKAILVPTQGRYQKNIDCSVVGETATQWLVQLPSEPKARRYHKMTMMAVSAIDRQFPNYQLTFPES